jgi:hypothetical protein
MPLSRLDNFLKNVRGNIIYVNPNDLDATDSITNQGNSMGRPFITIQRALVEAARFSYQKGLDNDRFGKTTILLSPGEHIVDNRPGWIPLNASDYRLRDGTQSSDFTSFNTASNFDLTSSKNDLYKLNSVSGGVIVPRGVSLVGQDLRKTTIRPLYIPDPENDNIETTAIFKITGGCYFFQFTIFDGNPNGTVYRNYTSGDIVPNFSHHKLTCFEYADGVNKIEIDDTFISNFKSERTDLDMYYEKVGLAYGTSSGREIQPDYPSSGLDIQPKIDEYRIVGPTGGGTEISAIQAGDGTLLGKSEIITVTLSEPLFGLDVDTAFQINGVSDVDYNGSFVVNEVLTSTTEGTTSFKYLNSVIPNSFAPTVAGALINLDIDTVSSASPYIFNISLRSVYGMCGMHADGAKASGFKSMVVAQFTGVSLQKDNNAFCKFDKSTGSFKFSSTVDNIHSDPDAKYRPQYYNYHIKASNNSVVQLVSIFAIGYAQHFVTDSGGDFSVTNSNSNFGAIALASKGYRDIAFERDDVGYITNIIPPKQLPTTTINLEYGSIDVTKTVGVGSTGRLYLHNEKNQSAPPKSVIQGYRIGSKVDDKLNLLITEGGESIKYQARIVMPDDTTTKKESSRKVFDVARVGSSNSISNNTLNLTSDHKFMDGETIRISSDNARLPDGVNNNRVYYAITTGLNDDQVKLAVSSNDASTGTSVDINNLGGNLIVESRVNDKVSGDIGHPIQYDINEDQWYVNVSSSSTDNQLYNKIITLGTSVLGEATSRTFINRLPDNRALADRIYRYRYVIPSGVGIQSARPPRDGYVLQMSNDVTGADNSEIALKYNPGSVTMSNQSQMRNLSFLRDANWDSGTIYYTSEQPHNLVTGSKLVIDNVTSTENPTGVAGSSYNGSKVVIGITSSHTFFVSQPDDPGTFTNNTSARTTDLPTFKTKRSDKTFYVYDVEQIKEYKTGEQDGIYYLTVIDSGNTPSVAPFNDSEEFSFSSPIVNLYPQLDRDNPVSDAPSAQTYALSNVLGSVEVNDPKNSITKVGVERVEKSYHLAQNITSIVSTSETDHEITLDREHGYNSIARVSISTPGTGYGNGTGADENIYNAILSSNILSGKESTSRITVDNTGAITDVRIISGGSNYNVGDVLNVTGTATTTGFSGGQVTVSAIQNNVGDTLRICGINSAFSTYNGFYSISGISTVNKVSLTSANLIVGYSTTPIGGDVTVNSCSRVTGPRLDIDSIDYDPVVGIASVTTIQNHGLVSDNVIRIGGSTNNFFNRNFTITQITSLNKFNIDIGISTNSQVASGTLAGYYVGTSPQGGTFTLYDENFGGRTSNSYAGISTVLSSPIINTSIDEIEIENLNNFNFNIGDYVRIDNEIMRVKTTVNSNPIKVFRGILGTRTSTHVQGSVIRKIHIQPVELRRTSIIRASGHTFEYLGYGPGNYSTSLPQRQAAQPGLTEQLLSQSFRSNGGVSVYTGMNDQGDFYIGNKRISSNTGKEEVFDTPVPTVTGEDIFTIGAESGVDVINPLDATISRGLKVEGGTQNNILSEFNGPVVFTEKITSTSDEGIEVNSMFLQGDTVVSRKYTVGLGTPVLAGNPGDVVYNANPSKGGTIGWNYSIESGWYPFGAISINPNGSEMLFDKIGVGTEDILPNQTFQVGSGSSLFAIDGDGGVGLGTTANGLKLNIEGDVHIGAGFTIYGDGSGITNQDSIWQKGGGNTFVYIKDDVNIKLGLGVSTGDIYGQIHSAGTAQTSLYVGNESRFDGISRFDSGVIVGGALTATGPFDLDNTSGTITAGVVTSTTIQSGAGSTILSVTSTGVGIGTTVARSALDVDGRARFNSYHEIAQTVTSSANDVELDLSIGQSFLLTTSENVTSFTLKGAALNSTTAFTLKITQDATTPYTVDIDNFRTESSSVIPVYWPGGIAPIVTTVAGRVDIYSFMTFDGGTSLYGVVGGQNFS